jgi:hypothetical protein
MSVATFDMSGIRVPHPKWWTPVLSLQEKDSLSQTLNPKPEAVQMREDAKWAPELPLKKKESFNKGTGTASSAVRTQASTVYVVLEGVKSANTASPVICGLIRLVHPGRAASFCGLLDGSRISAGEYGFEQRTIKAKVEPHEMEMAQVSIENLVAIPNTKYQTKPNQTKPASLGAILQV